MKIAFIKKRSLKEWGALAQGELQKILEECQDVPTLRKKGSSQFSWEVDVRLIGAPAIRELNHRYRGKDAPTDVLSFRAPEVFRVRGMLGELVICLPVLKKQAVELGHSPEEELRVLLVHGVLHLLGYDHELGPSQAATMRKWEGVLLQNLGGQRAVKRGLIERSR